MKTNDKIKKELEELAPKLSKLQKENPFEVPHNYFEKMQAEVLEKVKTPAIESAQSPWDVFLEKMQRWWAPKPIFALAGTALLVALFFFQNNSEIKTDAFAAIDPLLLEDYVEENIEEFEFDELLELALEEGVSFSFGENEEEVFIDEVLDEMDDAELLKLL